MASLFRSKSLPRQTSQQTSGSPGAGGRMLRRAQNLLHVPLPTMAEVQEDVFSSSPQQLQAPATPGARRPGIGERRKSDSSFSASFKKYVDNVSARIPGTPQSARRHARAMSESSTHRPKANSTPAPQPLQLDEKSAHAPSHKEPPPAADASFEIPLPLQHGTPMLKVSAKKIKTQVFRIDPDQGHILWESKKSGIVPIECIKEIRTGADARNYREQFKIAADAEERWLTIVYIIDNKYKTLHLVAMSRDVFNMWELSLRALHSMRMQLMDGLDHEALRQKLWERQHWRGADSQGDAKLDITEVENLCRRLNIYSSREDLEHRFKEADVQKRGYLDFVDFQRFVKLLKRRPEVERIFMKLSNEDEKFDFADFEKFMRDSQKCDLSRYELERIFNKFADTTPDGQVLASPPMTPKAAEVMLPAIAATLQPPVQGATDKTPAAQTAPEGTKHTLWSVRAFNSFLVSSENAAFADQHGRVWHDMSHPMSDYYIASSHNTYLVGNQLVGTSTFEGYIRALLCGCRSVELDIYDGDSEPVVYHGRTFTGRVSVREVCQAIMKYAFVVSPYPIVISAEIHCSLSQQDVLAKILREVFGNALVTERIDLPGKVTTGEIPIERLPSPEDLKYRVLLKAKNLLIALPEEDKSESESNTSSASEVTSASDSEPMKELKQFGETAARRLGLKRNKSKASSHGSPPAGTPIHHANTLPNLPLASPPAPSPEAVKMSLNLAKLLVYTVGVKCRGINKKERYATEQIFSLSERAANKYVKQAVMDLVKHNWTHVVRIYPAGTRLGSSNYEPHRFWAAGAQLVALNWQTFDLGYKINHAMFQRNGRSGYVLKPLALREEGRSLLEKKTNHTLEVKVISAQQLPRPKDSTGREVVDKQIVDPFVEVSVHVPDWTHSPFAAEEDRKQRSARTNVVKNNGFNPVWQEDISLPFDVVGDMRDLVFVRFEVKDENGTESRPLASYCVSLGSLQRGYRHLPLHDAQLSQFLFSTLFVRIDIRDA